MENWNSVICNIQRLWPRWKHDQPNGFRRVLQYLTELTEGADRISISNRFVLGFWQISPGRFLYAPTLLQRLLGRGRSSLSQFWRSFSAAISALMAFERAILRDLCPKGIRFVTFKVAEVMRLNGNARIHHPFWEADEEIDWI
jgi:hypothetical protein